MDKSLYVKTSTLRGVLFPNESDTICDHLCHKDYMNVYLNRIFDSKLSYFDSSKFKPSDDIAEEYSSVVIKLIITDPDHTGLWLVYEPDEHQVSIPGGHIDKEDVDYVFDELGKKDDSLFLIQETLARELYEELRGKVGKGLYEYSKSYEILYDPMDKINNMVYQQLKVLHPIDPLGDLWYIYKSPGREDARSFTLYYVMECKMTRPYHHLIWLDKNEWRISRRCKTNRDKESILGEMIVPAKSDIRFSDHYSPILDAIFNTTELF